MPVDKEYDMTKARTRMNYDQDHTTKAMGFCGPGRRGRAERFADLDYTYTRDTRGTRSAWSVATSRIPFGFADYLRLQSWPCVKCVHNRQPKEPQIQHHVVRHS